MQSLWIAALMSLQGVTAGGIPAPPPPRHYVVDEAGLLDSTDLRLVDSVTAARAGARMPLYVLTIRSVAAHDSTDMTFEQFSKQTFEAWRKGVPGSDHAALLLVSVEDRRARIEVGPAWGHAHDAMLQRVMADALEPAIARNSLDQGIRAATNEITWVLQAPAVSPWLRDGLAGVGVLAAGVLALGYLRRRRSVVVPPSPRPRPMAEVDPNLRVSQRLQALNEARTKSEKAASSITWLDTGEMPKYEEGAPKPPDEDEKD